LCDSPKGFCIKWCKICKKKSLRRCKNKHFRRCSQFLNTWGKSIMQCKPFFKIKLFLFHLYLSSICISIVFNRSHRRDPTKYLQNSHAPLSDKQTKDKQKQTNQQTHNICCYPSAYKRTLYWVQYPCTDPPDPSLNPQNLTP